MIAAHKNTNGELRFVHFKRALPHFRFEDKKLCINITKFEKWPFSYNLVFGGFSATAGLLLFGLTGFVEPPTTIASLLKYVGTILFICLVGVLMVIEAFPLFSASKVGKELKKFTDNSKNKNNGIG